MAQKDPLTPIRREKLKAWIKQKYGGNKSKAAQEAGKHESQFNDMLAGRKSFGGKIAREIEIKLRMPTYFLDVDDDANLKSPAPTDWPFGPKLREAYDRLTEEQKREIGYWVQGRIADFEREAPNAAGKKRRGSNGAKS